MRIVSSLAGITCLVALVGCVQVQPSRPEPLYAPTYPDVAVPEPASGGSLFPTSGTLDLYVDRKALRVGDLLTIRLEESTSSSKSADTSISKASTTSIPNPTLFGKVFNGVGDGNDGLLNGLETDNGFNGSAASDQSNSLNGTITAVIAKVLPNGLMQVQGEKWLQLNRGEEFVRISGLVRPEDVTGNNTVSSLRLGDARIAYSGTGELADSNRAGWLTRFFLNPLFPF
ncbi:MAG: flagellar basal body L-ring protein FlgH [Pseudomonadales bacterium]|nr:flagellar basal body L-ring protein FlgH [Pseudomonadales bacterium]MCP5184729.1 flagellar basal body L-ring protein FlgH [Pseudomonadales bacterium]